MTSTQTDVAPGLDDIDALRKRLADKVRVTPVLQADALGAALPVAGISVKMELWQRTGSFKARGALANMLSLDAAQLERGVTAVSAGNHAIATAFAARELGSHAKVVMTRSAPAIRVERCRSFGAEVVLADSVHDAFAVAEAIASDEQRAFIHPFEGLITATATAGVGRELMLDAGPLDAVIVPVGGGGLAAGVAAAVKQTAPDCAVYGIEPVGADSMTRSLAAGAPQTLESVNTIADSLGAPMALPVSFSLCRRFIDEMILVSDDQIRTAMRTILSEMSMMVEPACAAALAALQGPLRERLAGQRVGLIFCGSNIDLAGWQAAVGR